MYVVNACSSSSNVAKLITTTTNHVMLSYTLEFSDIQRWLWVMGHGYDDVICNIRVFQYFSILLLYSYVTYH